MVSFAESFFSEAIPALDLFELVLERQVELIVLEDNQAAIKILSKGYSQKLRHVLRNHKVNIGSVHDAIEANPGISVVYVNTNYQSADIFTKSLTPQKWGPALALLGIDTTPPEVVEADSTKTETVADTPAPVKAAVKPSQECSHPQPVKGAAAACAACDECLGSVEKITTDEDIQKSVHLAAACVSAAASKPKHPRPRASGKLKCWGQLFEICTSADSNLGKAADE